MKRIIFLLTIVCACVATYYFVNRNESFSRGEIAPSGEWLEKLSGLWSYHYILEDKNRIRHDIGRIRFYNRNAFELTISSELSYKSNEETYLKFNGTASGIIKFIEASHFQLITNECNMNVSFGNDTLFRPCKNYKLKDYGTFESTRFNGETLQFNSNKITFRGVNFEGNTKYSLQMEKIKN